MHPAFLFKAVVLLQALLLTKRICTQTALSKFPDQQVKGVMRTSGEIDFLFRLRLRPW